MDKEPKKPTTRRMGKTIGASGTRIISGYISDEEYNSGLVGKTGIREFDKMRRSDATVRSALQVVKLPVLSAEWTVDPASDDEQDVARCEFIKDELFNVLDWSRFMREAMTFLEFGHAIAEKTLMLRNYDGRPMIGIKEVGFRKQTTIEGWELDNGRPGVQQLLPEGGVVEIPREKLMYFVNDIEGENYEGTSLLRYAYRDWDMKYKLILINGIGLERQGTGQPVIKHPADASPAEIAKADEVMREFRTNEEAYQRLPVGWELEMLDMKANTTKEILPTIQYHDRQIHTSVLAQFLSLGASDASGSRAVSEDQSKLFLMSEQALAKTLRDTIQKELINPICDLNFTDMPNGYPQLTFSRIGDEDLKEISESVSKLMSSGAITYTLETENHIRRIAKMAEITEEEMEKIKQEKEDEQAKEDLAKQKNKDPDVEASQAVNAAKVARRKLIDVLVR